MLFNHSGHFRACACAYARICVCACVRVRVYYVVYSVLLLPILLPVGISLFWIDGRRVGVGRHLPHHMEHSSPKWLPSTTLSSAA